MKRLIALILCLVMCVSVFAACGEEEPAEDTTKSGTQSTTKPQDTDDTTGPQEGGDETTEPDDSDDVTTEEEPGIERPDINLSLPENPKKEKLAIEDIGAKDAGTVPENYETLGKIGISSLSEITDPVGEYYLTDDISSNDTTIEEFHGLLDGCGHTITTEVPLFGTLGGYVINLNLEGEISFTAEPEAPLANAIVSYAVIYNVKNTCDVEVKRSEMSNIYAGGFAVYVYGEDVIFANCEYAGTITNVYDAKSNNRYTGGFVGSIREDAENDDADTPVVDFVYCTFSGDVQASSHVGGLVGEVLVLAYVNLYGCLSDGEVTGTFEGAAGGLLGYMSGDSSAELFVYNCANKTEVVSNNISGGLVGSNSAKGGINYMEFKWCTNYAKITGVTRVSGIVARVIGSSTFENCINHGNLLANLSKDKEGKLSATSTVSFMGGILGETDGKENQQKFEAIFKDCVNYGNIDSYGKTARLGGISGHHEYVPLVATNCVNFGDIKSHYVPADNAAGDHRFGGITGGGKGNWQGFYNCVNFGDITVNHAATGQPSGGMIGYSAGTRTYLIMENCMNYGNIDNSAAKPVTITVKEKDNDGNEVEVTKTVQGSALGGLAGYCLSHTKEFKISGCINGGKLNSTHSVADLFAWRQVEDDASYGESTVTMSNVYYLADAYTGDVVHGQFIWDIDGTPSVRTGDFLTAEAVRESDITDGTDVGLAAKMNTVAGEELFTCVTVKLDDKNIETKTCVIPTAILELIADRIGN